MKKARIQYTLRNVPPRLDSLLRDKARRQRKSLNEVALEALNAGSGLGAGARYDDLDAFFGSWIADRAVDAALRDQRRVDEGLWR